MSRSVWFRTTDSCWHLPFLARCKIYFYREAKRKHMYRFIQQEKPHHFPLQSHRVCTSTRNALATMYRRAVYATSADLYVWRRSLIFNHVSKTISPASERKKTAVGKMRISSYINLVAALRRLVPAQTDIHHSAESIPVVQFVTLSESISCSQKMSVNAIAICFFCLVQK